MPDFFYLPLVNLTFLHLSFLIKFQKLFGFLHLSSVQLNDGKKFFFQSYLTIKRKHLIYKIEETSKSYLSHQKTKFYDLFQGI